MSKDYEFREYRSEDASGAMVATIKVTPQLKERVFEEVMNFFAKHECWSGESYSQTDEPQIDSVEFMSDLLDDVIQADVEYIDENV